MRLVIGGAQCVEGWEDWMMGFLLSCLLTLA